MPAAPSAHLRSMVTIAMVTIAMVTIALYGSSYS